MTLGSPFKFTPTKDSSFFTASCIWLYCHWILYSLYIMSSFANVFFVLTKTHFIKKWINKEQFKNASFKSDKQPPDVFSKNVPLKGVHKFHRKHLSDLKASRESNASETCEIFKNIYFEEHLPMTGSFKTVPFALKH